MIKVTDLINFLKQANGILKVKVTPNSSKNEIVKLENVILQVKLRAKAINNQANLGLIEFLAKELKITKGSIVILKGLKQKNKLLKIDID